MTSKTLAVICAIFVIAAVGYACWQLERHINYTFGYRDMVEQTVRDLVKPEALK